MVTRFLVDLVHLSLGPTALGLKCTKSTRNLEPMLYLLHIDHVTCVQNSIIVKVLAGYSLICESFAVDLQLV